MFAVLINTFVMPKGSAHFFNIFIGNFRYINKLHDRKYLDKFIVFMH